MARSRRPKGGPAKGRPAKPAGGSQDGKVKSANADVVGGEGTSPRGWSQLQALARAINPDLPPARKWKVSAVKNSPGGKELAEKSSSGQTAQEDPPEHEEEGERVHLARQLRELRHQILHCGHWRGVAGRYCEWVVSFLENPDADFVGEPLLDPCEFLDTSELLVRALVRYAAGQSTDMVRLFTSTALHLCYDGPDLGQLARWSQMAILRQAFGEADESARMLIEELRRQELEIELPRDRWQQRLYAAGFSPSRYGALEAAAEHIEKVKKPVDTDDLSRYCNFKRYIYSSSMAQAQILKLFHLIAAPDKGYWPTFLPLKPAWRVVTKLPRGGTESK